MIEIESIADGDYRILVFHQNLDGVQVRDLKQTLAEVLPEESRMVAVDLRKVKKLSTAGLGLIYTMFNRARDADMSIAFICNREVTERIGEMAEDSRLTVVPSLEKAKLLLRTMHFRLKKQAK